LDNHEGHDAIDGHEEKSRIGLFVIVPFDLIVSFVVKCG